MTTRDEIYTDGSYNDQTDNGGWAAIRLRHTSGQKNGTTNQEMELRAIVEAVKMAEGPTTVICDHQGIVSIANRGMTPRWSPDVWSELYAATAGKEVTFEWRERSQSFGQRLAHQLAREALKRQPERLLARHLQLSSALNGSPQCSSVLITQAECRGVDPGRDYCLHLIARTQWTTRPTPHPPFPPPALPG